MKQPVTKENMQAVLKIVQGQKKIIRAENVTKVFNTKLKDSKKADREMRKLKKMTQALKILSKAVINICS